MRIIAGEARGRPIEAPSGLHTRPTLDRVRENMFNMIQYEVPGSCILDLFAGSGAIGIEALSRGADEAVFVENNRQALRCIHENLNFTRLAPQGRVLAGDVIQTVQDMNGEKPFTIIFMDPPYDCGLEKRVLETLADSTLVDENTVIIAEASKDTDFSYAQELGYRIDRVKEYKTNKHVFLKKE